jgi:hypothetical protein
MLGSTPLSYGLPGRREAMSGTRRTMIARSGGTSSAHELAPAALRAGDPQLRAEGAARP